MKKGITLLICLSMILAGCGSNRAASSTSSSSDDRFDIDSAIAEAGGTLEVETATFSEEQTKHLETICSEIQDAEAFYSEIACNATYPLFDDIPFEESYQRWISAPAYDGGTSYKLIQNRHVDEEEFYNQVIENNAKFKTTTESYTPELDDDELRLCCEVICKTVNAELQNYDFTNRLDDIDSNLYHLGIFQDNGLNGGTVNKDGIMTFNETMSESMGTINGSDQGVEITIAHETEHLMQQTSKEAMDAIGCIFSHGFMLEWDDMEFNPSFYYWFVEGSAELLASSLYDSDPLTYINRIGYINTISLITSVGGYSWLEFPRMTQSDSLDNFFTMFHCTTEAEKISLMQWFYAQEIMHNTPDSMEAYYKEQTGKEFDETESEIYNLQLKYVWLQYANTLFYTNLTEFINQNKPTLEEVFQIMSIWDMDLAYHLDYQIDATKEEFDTCTTDCIQTQSAFLEKLGESVGMTAEAIEAEYDIYYNSIEYWSDFTGSTWVQKNISAFDEETNRRLNNFGEDRAEGKKDRIAVSCEENVG